MRFVLSAVVAAFAMATTTRAEEGSWSSLVLVNGRLLVANQSGQVSVLAAAPKFELLDRNAIPTETTCSSLAIANGHVFLRTHDALWCFGNTP